MHLTENLPHHVPRVGVRLAEDEDARVVVHTEGLLGGRKVDLHRSVLAHIISLYECKRVLLIGKDERPELRIGGDIRCQLKPELSGEESPVVRRRQGIASRQAGNGRVEPVAGQEDPVGLIQPVVQLPPLLIRILVVILHFDPRVHAAEGIVPVNPQRQAPVPVLIGHRGSRRYVLIDPAGRCNPRVRPQVDAEERDSPRQGTESHAGNDTPSTPPLPSHVGTIAAQAVTRPRGRKAVQ